MRTAPFRNHGGEVASHRRQRQRRAAARTLLRVAAASDLLGAHHSAQKMAPQAERKICPKKSCKASNFADNKHCYKCQTCLPNQTTPKGGGKGGGKDAGKGKGKGKGSGGDKPKKTSNKDKEECLCCGKLGHTKDVCHARHKECSNCGKVGHLAAVCHGPKASKDKGGPPWKDKAWGGANGLSEEDLDEMIKKRGLRLEKTADGQLVRDAPAAQEAKEMTTSSVKALIDIKDRDEIRYKKTLDVVTKATNALKKATEDAEAAALALFESEARMQEGIESMHKLTSPPQSNVVPPCIDVPQFIEAARKDDVSALMPNFGTLFKHCEEDDEQGRAEIAKLEHDMKQFLTETLSKVMVPMITKFDESMRAVSDTRSKRRCTAMGGIAVDPSSTSCPAAAPGLAPSAAQKAKEDAASPAAPPSPADVAAQNAKNDAAKAALGAEAKQKEEKAKADAAAVAAAAKKEEEDKRAALDASIRASALKSRAQALKEAEAVAAQTALPAEEKEDV